MSAIPLRRNRDFILLWSGQVVSTLGSEVSGLAFPLLVLSLTGSPARAGIVGFARGLPYLLVYLPAGAPVDRWNRKHVCSPPTRAAHSQSEASPRLDDDLPTREASPAAAG